MAKTLIQLENGLRIKYLVKPKKYFLFQGSAQICIDRKWQSGFDSQEDAERLGKECVQFGFWNFTTPNFRVDDRLLQEHRIS